MSSGNHRYFLVVFAALALVGISVFVGYRLAGKEQKSADANATAVEVAAKGRVLYWYDPMQPGQHFDKPGKSPFMDMELIPKYADDAMGGGEVKGVQIDAGISQNLGIRLTTVERGPLAQRISAVGSITFNQRDLAVIQARSNGFVTRVYARAPGDLIQTNAPLIDLLVPEWTSAQTEFIAVLESGDAALIEAARERMALLGMPMELIAAVERTRQAQKSVTIRSPLAGVIATLDAHTGMSISSGATIASVNALSTVWLEAAIPEARAMSIPVGQAVTTRLTAFPGEAFAGRVAAVLPQASAETRTLRVRIELPNPTLRLKPGMYAEVSLASADAAPVVYVASEALIRTETRSVAIVARQAGRYVPTIVEVGPDIDGKSVILRGLLVGDRVVASGQFLIDSEANLQGVLARLGASSDTRAKPDDSPETRP